MTGYLLLTWTLASLARSVLFVQIRDTERDVAKVRACLEKAEPAASLRMAIEEAIAVKYLGEKKSTSAGL